MLRRVQCTSPRLSLLVVVPAAIALASCGGSIGGDSVTGISVDDVAAEAAVVGLAPLEAVPDDFDLDELDLDEGLPSDLEWDPVLDADHPAAEDGTITESCRRRRIKICYKGRTKRVPRWKVWRYLRRGATLGPCKPAATCPCFSSSDIQSAAGACVGIQSATCNVGDPYQMAIGCDPGGTDPQVILGVYLSQTANGGYCSRDDVNGSVSQDGLSDAEYQACVSEITGSGYCS